MLVLPNRKCGKVKGGGIYLVGGLSPEGTLLPFTALAAPFEALIAHPRSYQIIDISTTLHYADGLRVSADLGGLPMLGIADLWGKSAGYANIWDVVEETLNMGLSRRVANVPDLPRPFPVLMMHMEAVLDMPDPEYVRGWWDEKYEVSLHEEETYSLLSQPWRDAESLGHVGDDTYLDHPYVRLWAVMANMDPDAKAWFLEGNQIELRQGVLGFSWVSQVAYVLKADETDVPEHLAEKGAVAAVGESDPRATGVRGV